jgi:hypothetical protein
LGHCESAELQNLKEAKALCRLEAQTEAQSMPQNNLILFNLITKVKTLFNSVYLEGCHHDGYRQGLPFLDSNTEFRHETPGHIVIKVYF